MTAEVKYVWVIDNVSSQLSGNLFQVTTTSGQGDTPDSRGHDFFVAGNTGTNSRQALVWMKRCGDVVVSENTYHLGRDYRGGQGDAFGYQYGPDNVWFLANTAYDCEHGFRCSEDQGSSDWTTYIIGNLFYDIKNLAGAHNWDVYYGVGVHLMRGGNTGTAVQYVGFNTIHSARSGVVANQQGASAQIWSNVLSNISEEHILITAQRSTLAEVDYNLYDSGDTFEVQWDAANYTSLAAFQSGESQAANGVSGTPDFVTESVVAGTADFDITATSDAINAGSITAPNGVNVFDVFLARYGVDIEQDILGRARTYGASPDIGAYERQS